MASDILSEQRLTLTEAAKRLDVHVASIHRWIGPGVRGCRLETFYLGCKRFTTVEAIERFQIACTAAANGTVPPADTPRRREQRIDAAERQLAEMGM
jgi:hypothetical protein